MDANMIIQFSIVGVVLLAAFGWLFWKTFSKQKKKTNSCCGCALADNCNKKNLKKDHGKNKNL